MGISLLLAKTAWGPGTGRMAAASKTMDGHFATFIAIIANFSEGWQSTRRALSHCEIRCFVLPASDFATLPHPQEMLFSWESTTRCSAETVLLHLDSC